MDGERVTHAALMSARSCVRKISDRKRNSHAHRRKIFGGDGAVRRESLHRFARFDRFRCFMTRAQVIVQNFALHLHRIMSTAANLRTCARFYSRAAPAAHQRRCKESLFHRCFCNMRAMCAQRCSAFVYYDVACAVRTVTRARQAQRVSHTHVVKWSQCFFHCSVVNGVQCVSIPDRTDATPAMIHG